MAFHFPIKPLPPLGMLTLSLHLLSLSEVKRGQHLSPAAIQNGARDFRTLLSHVENERENCILTYHLLEAIIPIVSSI